MLADLKYYLKGIISYINEKCYANKNIVKIIVFCFITFTFVCIIACLLLEEPKTHIEPLDWFAINPSKENYLKENKTLKVISAIGAKTEIDLENEIVGCLASSFNTANLANEIYNLGSSIKDTKSLSEIRRFIIPANAYFIELKTDDYKYITLDQHLSSFPSIGIYAWKIVDDINSKNSNINIVLVLGDDCIHVSIINTNKFLHHSSSNTIQIYKVEDENAALQ
jgi:hypothetical protein